MNWINQLTTFQFSIPRFQDSTQFSIKIELFGNQFDIVSFFVMLNVPSTFFSLIPIIITFHGHWIIRPDPLFG